MLNIRIKKLRVDAVLPTYATDGSAGFDFYSLENHELMRGHPHVFSTGLSMEIPLGYVLLIFSRSGHGFRYDTRLANATGVIDSDYRGEIFIKLCQDYAVPSPSNTAGEHLFVNRFDRIAQGIIIPYPKIDWVLSSDLTETDRGVDGLGSTGS